MRHKAIVGRIEHGRVQEAVDIDRTGLFLQLILHGIAAERHFDHNINFKGWIVANRNLAEIHCLKTFLEFAS